MPVNCLHLWQDIPPLGARASTRQQLSTRVLPLTFRRKMSERCRTCGLPSEVGTANNARFPAYEFREPQVIVNYCLVFSSILSMLATFLAPSSACWVGGKFLCRRFPNYWNLNDFGFHQSPAVSYRYTISGQLSLNIV